jgi:type IV pilus assembly protein PilM
MGKFNLGDSLNLNIPDSFKNLNPFSGRGPQAKLGLDIGTRYIKMAMLHASSQGIQLSKYGFSATPVGAITEGTMNNPEAIGEAIWQILTHYKIKEKRVLCSLPGRAVIIRQVSIPGGLPEKEIKQATISEVERFLPFPMDEMEYTYHKLGEISQGDVKQQSVLFVAAHKDSVQRRVEAARFAGLESVEIDVDPFVILRSVMESSLVEEPDTFSQTILLLDMGASATNVSIIHAGFLRFTRIFAIGGDTLTHAIESGYDATYLEAEKLKMEKGVAVLDEEVMEIDDEMREIHEMISTHLDTLALEIRRSLAYYTSKYRGESVTQIILTGGGSLLRGVGRFFEDDLGIPVSFGNPLQNIPYIGDGDIQSLARLVPFQGIAVGLALRQVPQRMLARYTIDVGIEPNYEFGSTAQAGGAS